jgi:peptidoglycan/LPS O-acetylase OafA/YrhL
MSVRNQHFTTIDGLRGVAILLVCFFHYGLTYAGNGIYGNTLVASGLQVGWMGVDLFFVVSGFLITSILLETRGEPRYFGNFIARRTLRIWPLYYLSLFVLIVVAPRVLHPVPADLAVLADKQVWFWTYAANWLFASEGGFNQTPSGYYWSLAVEEQFYLLWPLVVWKTAETSLRWVCVGMIAGSLILRLVLLQYGVPESSVYTITFTHLEAVAGGSLLALLVRDPLWTARVVRWSTAALLIGVAGLLLVRSFDHSFKFWERGMAHYGLTCVALVSAALLVKAHIGAGDSWFRRALRSRPIVATGRYSYALYIAHVPVGVQLDKMGSKWLDAASTAAQYDFRFTCVSGAALGISWLVAMLSWHLFERHVLKLKRYF